jgi:Ca2+-transporting ATPase
MRPLVAKIESTNRTQHELLPGKPHALAVNDALALMGVSVAAGLTSQEVRDRRNRFGPNKIVSRRKAHALFLLLHQFQSPVVYLLSTAAGLAFFFREFEEGVAIVAVLAANALIGFVTELKAVRSIEALRALGTRSVRVRRDGHVRLVPAAEIVPGDIVVLEAGDSVAADLRLIEASSLAADESTLTGESVTVDKYVEPVPADARLADRASMLFKGTAVTRGTGIGLVVGTGFETELGRVSQLVEEAEPGSSPLEKKLARLSAQLVWATLGIATLIAIVGLGTGRDAFLIAEAAIALAVAAIPEGLPVVATLTLARGMWRMAQQNALIERLSAVETLGATTIILTDKTGTLTENRMRVRRLWLPSGEIDLTVDFSEANWKALGEDPQASLLLKIAVLCNNASLGTAPEQGSGDPMELALLRSGLRAGLKRSELTQRSPIVRKHAFDANTKMMATVHVEGDQFLFAIKGAPEAVLHVATKVIGEHGEVALDHQTRSEWLARVEHLGHQGLRVLACAMKTGAPASAPPYEVLTLIGLIAFEDPARADVPQAIRDCRQAGVRVVMVTGDHAITARSIARAVGLGPSVANVIEGKHLAQITDGQHSELLKADIFARVSPAEKLDLVRAYQSAGEIVAMTGDGVNDAPALRQADIGIAMGMRGTDVAREAAAMVLLDDAFPTIVRAIREGRVIFGNIRRFMAYLLSCNLSEVLVVGLAVLLGLPLPLLPLQILYLNLVTDVFPAFALAMGEGEPGVLKRPPRPPREPILGRTQWTIIVLHSSALSVSTFGALALAIFWLDLDGRSTVTVTFLTLAFAQLFHVFNMRHPRSGLLRNEVTGNPWLWASLALCVLLLLVPAYLPGAAHVLHLIPPSPAMWEVITCLSVAPLLVTQAVTFIVISGRTKTQGS